MLLFKEKKVNASKNNSLLTHNNAFCCNNLLPRQQRGMEYRETRAKNDSTQGSPYTSAQKDLPLLSGINAGTLTYPMEPPASRNTQLLREIPLSFYPNDIPTAALASSMIAHEQAPVQGKAEAPQAISQSSPPPAGPSQQAVHDVLADIPPLPPPVKPSVLRELFGGNARAKDVKGKRGHDHLQHHCQQRRVSHQRRMRRVPHEVSNISVGVKNPVLGLQTYGSTGRCNSQNRSSKEQKANRQSPPEGITRCLCL